MIPNLIRDFNSYEASGRSPSKWEAVKPHLLKFKNKCIYPIHLVEASPHKVVMIVGWRGLDWRVRLLPTYFNIDVRIDGQDDHHQKAELSALLKEIIY